jgi:hypothetical protein
MQQCETSTGNDSSVKRVTVRSGGAGHAHSGVVKADAPPQDAAPRKSVKLVRLGR